MIMKFLKKTFGFIKHIDMLFDMYMFVFGRKYLKKEKDVLHELKQMEKLSDEQIYNLQRVKLLNYLQYAYDNTTYYKNLFDKHKIDLNTVESLKNIPILTKNIIKDNMKDLKSKIYDPEALVKRNTGGSTGEPLEFYSDRMSAYIDNAHHWYLYSLMGYRKGDVIMDSGGTIVPEKLRNKNIYWLKELKSSVWGEYNFSVLYITDLNIKYYINKFLEIKPTILRGYPSFFDKLATYILKNNITIDFNIKGINLTAEMCSLSQRTNIEKAFSSMVYFEYGHSEVCVYCYTKDETYIYNSSPIYGYVEALNENGEYARAGDIGNIVVTGFNNYGMPFIRYDTGDMGEVLKRNGGIIHFKKILGRNQDYIISKDNQKIFLTALIFGQHLKAFKNISKWQLFQEKIGEVQISIVKSSTYSKEDEKEILNNFQSVTNIDLIFNYVETIPLTKRGKHLFLIQHIGINDES